jgi:preprotein translocase subunit SecB
MDQQVVPSVNLINQYIKSLRLENFIEGSYDPASETSPPQISINVIAEASSLTDDLFESRIKITAGGVSSSGVNLFELELNYAGIFSLAGVPDDDLELLLLVYCPSITFPFVRRVVADVTRDAGFPPLMVQIVDFAKLYQQSKQ